MIAQLNATVDPSEVRLFDGEAEIWWDEAAWIYKLNPVRVTYILDLIARVFNRPEKQDLDGLCILDLGCGAGVLSEPLAARGAHVKGVDPARSLIAKAQRHMLEEGLLIDYRCTRPEVLADASELFYVVLALDVAEHVADSTLFIDMCSRLVVPGGLILFSTVNRTWKSWFEVIAMGEYILRYLPRGTHRWNKFIKPDEIQASSALASFTMVDLKGLSMKLRQWRLEISNKIDVIYFIALRAPPTSKKCVRA